MVALAQTRNLAQQLDSEESSSGKHVWLDNKHGLVTGDFPVPIAKFDFASEKLVAISDSKAPIEKKRISHLGKAKRVVRRYELETEHEVHLFGSATQLLVEGLNWIEDTVPGTLEQLSQIKGRSKRAVARTREELYDIPRPAKYSQKLRSGFFVATNNKDLEARGYLRQAAELAGFKWGKDFVVQAA